MAALLGAGLAVVVFARWGPLPPEAPHAAPAGTVVLASDGTVLWRDAAEGLRIPVPVSEVSPAVIDATIAAEDQRFRSHAGFDPLAMVRAAARLHVERSGASTITQQLARGTYLSPDQPLALRKPRELLLAVQIDARLGKDEILERYLNSTYYGREAYGIEAAARVYFGVSAANLDVARAAFLAGLAQNPGAGADPAGSGRARQHYVLDRMLAAGTIDAATRDAAKAAPVAVLAAPVPPLAEHFVSYGREELGRLRPDLADVPGLVIETTLDAGLQAAAEDQALLQLDRLERNEARNAAVVILDPRDGRVLAMAGNVTRSESGARYNMATTPRQPGSALKPFLYSLALERGYTAASPLLDVPTTFKTRNGVYSPQNYDLAFRGVVTLRTALASSLNVPAVGMLAEIGIDPFMERLRAAGVTTLTDVERYDLALALGSGEISLLELANAYGALANGGLAVEPFAIVRVRDGNGRILYERGAADGSQVFDPGVAAIVSDILADPQAREPGFGSRSVLELPFAAAVKTGTTTDFRDNWTIGYTPRQVVGVWVGNVDRSAMRDVSGVSGAAPIWAELTTAARMVQGDASFAMPASVRQVEVCSPTGQLPGAACPAVSMEWFLAGSEPAAPERYYVLDAQGRTVLDPPPEARPWLRDGNYPLSQANEAMVMSPALAIVQPAEGSVLYMAAELTRQEVVLRVGCPPGVEAATVMLDADVVGTMAGCPDRAVLPLAAGSHTLRVQVTTADGTTFEATTRYEVRTR